MNYDTIENKLEKSIQLLFEKLEKSLPETGDFPEISVKIDDFRTDVNWPVELIVGPWSYSQKSAFQDWKKTRYFEVKVYSPDRESDSSQWIYNGSKEKIISSLKKDKAIEVVINAIYSGIEHIRRDLSSKDFPGE